MEVNQHRLSAKTIHTIGNGEAEAVIDSAMEVVCEDMADRDDQTERQVIITLRYKKREDGFVEIDCAATTKLPSKRTFSSISKMTTVAGVTGLLIGTFEDNPDQKHLNFESGGEDRAAGN